MFCSVNWSRFRSRTSSLKTEKPRFPLFATSNHDLIPLAEADHGVLNTFTAR